MKTQAVKTQAVALSAAALASVLLGVAAFASAPLPGVEPIRATPVRTITITAAPPRLSAEPGLRFSRVDADGCRTVSRPVVGEDGRVVRQAELACRH